MGDNFPGMSRRARKTRRRKASSIERLGPPVDTTPAPPRRRRILAATLEGFLVLLLMVVFWTSRGAESGGGEEAAPTKGAGVRREPGLDAQRAFRRHLTETLVGVVRKAQPLVDVVVRDGGAGDNRRTRGRKQNEADEECL